MPKTGISDKIEHFLGYFLLAFLLCNTLYFQDKKVNMKKFPVTWALFIAAFYGMVDELHQYFIPGRICDINDWIADITGAVIAGLLYFFLKMYFQEVQKRRNISLTN
jgi:VanZ family protein